MHKRTIVVRAETNWAKGSKDKTRKRGSNFMAVGLSHRVMAKGRNTPKLESKIDCNGRMESYDAVPMRQFAIRANIGTWFSQCAKYVRCDCCWCTYLHSTIDIFCTWKPSIRIWRKCNASQSHLGGGTSPPIFIKRCHGRNITPFQEPKANREPIFVSANISSAIVRWASSLPLSQTKYIASRQTKVQCKRKA